MGLQGFPKVGRYLFGGPCREDDSFRAPSYEKVVWRGIFSGLEMACWSVLGLGS